jgi:hypothetical protein
MREIRHRVRRRWSHDKPLKPALLNDPENKGVFRILFEEHSTFVAGLCKSSQRRYHRTTFTAARESTAAIRAWPEALAPT